MTEEITGEITGAEGHAVVLGASLGGLLAARVLADFFDRVTVIERDQLPADASPRRGVPQGRHLHGLLPRGRQALDGLFPGLVDELVSEGAPRAEFLSEVRLVFSGHQLARANAGVSSIQASRPLLESRLLVIVGPVPGHPRMMGFGIQEGDRWLLTLGGMAGDHPVPRKRRSCPSPRPSRLRSRRFPAGLLVFGDAICSFNPVYGQGMTVAALEAEALHRCLLDRRRDLPRRFFRAAAKVIDPAWQLAAGGDLALPEIPGRRSMVTPMLNRYIARLHRAAEHDSQVATAFVRVAALLDPPSAIATPRIMARVLAGGHRRTS